MELRSVRPGALGAHTRRRPGDRFGRRRLFVIGAAIFGAASLWCALVPDTGQLVVARAVQGLGGALDSCFAGDRRGVVRREAKGRAIGAWGRSAAWRWR